MFPTYRQFKKWTLPTQWGFVGSLVGVFGLVLSIVFFVVPYFAPPPSGIPQKGGTDPADLQNAPSTAVLDEQSRQLVKQFEANSKANLEFYNEALAFYERSADEARDFLTAVCQFTEGSGVRATDNATVFFQKYNGWSGHPKLGDSLIKSLEGKFVEWALKVTKVHISNDGFAYVLFESAVDPCPKSACPKNSFISSVVQLEQDNKFVQETKVGNFFRLSGILRLWDNPSGRTYPLTVRMTIQPLTIKYRDESPSECLEIEPKN